MKERPILMSAPMVRAILAGQKTQTRRAVKPSTRRPIEFLGGGPKGGPDWNNPECWGYEHHDNATWVLLKADNSTDTALYPCPYGHPGDRLWVRERGWIAKSKQAFLPFIDNERVLPPVSPDGTPYRVCPSIHMPRWASRITLEITGVRVERLQDISEEDATAEGIVQEVRDPGLGRGGRPGWRWAENEYAGSAVHGYELLWESLNGPGSWAPNPWVWVVEFRRSPA